MAAVVVRKIATLNLKASGNLKAYGMLKTILGAILVLLTVSCGYTTAERVKASVGAPKPVINAFSHCSAYGCQMVQKVSFDVDEWQSVIGVFEVSPNTAEEERQALQIAIARMEQIIGPKTGTNDDIAKSWLLTFVPKGQLDCIDESINTTTYLNLLNDAGFVKHHDIGKIALRGGGITFTLLHNTATLIDRNNGNEFAVDSWFRKNGVAPDVVPLEEWLSGWGPSE